MDRLASASKCIKIDRLAYDQAVLVRHVLFGCHDVRVERSNRQRYHFLCRGDHTRYADHQGQDKPGSVLARGE